MTSGGGSPRRNPRSRRRGGRLRSRLAALYDKDQADRNQDLIDFYQNLIRLKEIGIKDVKSVTTREQEYLGAISKEKAEDKTDHKKEMENMASLYSDMLDSFNGNDLISSLALAAP